LGNSIIANEEWQIYSLLIFCPPDFGKICKAFWVKNNENNIPPKIHNLVKILHESRQEISDEDLIFLEEFNDFQLEGRYPDYLFKINTICNKDYTTSIINRVKKIKQCLIEKLQ
jgi:hypothetical protein